MQFLAEYGLFLAKTITWVIAILILMGGIFAIASKNKDKAKGVTIKHLNKEYDDMADNLQETLLSKEEIKKLAKARKADKKSKEKSDSKPRIFVLEFKGDVKASRVDNLTKEIDALLTVATPDDEVLVKIESGGGMVHSYGYGASQLQRIRDRGIKLTTAVDKVAASGGYLMACVGDKIIAAPFAIIGSIGVIMQLPNFNRFLKKHHVDFEMLSAGKYKRTLTVFGENNDAARKKAKSDLEDIHHLFKDFVTEHRPMLDMEQVATGEIWLGKKAKTLGLLDELTTSDDYLIFRRESADIYKLDYKGKKSFVEKLSGGSASIVDSVLDRCQTRIAEPEIR